MDDCLVPQDFRHGGVKGKRTGSFQLLGSYRSVRAGEQNSGVGHILSEVTALIFWLPWDLTEPLHLSLWLFICAVGTETRPPVQKTE